MARVGEPGAQQRGVAVLELDPDLVGDLEPGEATVARRLARTDVLAAARGRWQPPRLGDDGAGWLGFLVLEGLLARDVLLAGVGCTELVGRGDLLHPWDQYEGEPSVPFDVEWTVLEPTRLAVLDARFAALAGRWPGVTARLVGRAARLTHSLGVHFAITCLVGLDVRLYVLFWHLADRFGRVERGGAVVPLRLTHDSLARLVRARRPSVTLALGRLREQELVTRREDGSWLLGGNPPEELERLRARVAGSREREMDSREPPP